MAIGNDNRNRQRKAAYKNLASEGDKEARNRAIEAALGAGANNFTASDKVEVIEVEVKDEKTGRMRMQREKVITPKEDSLVMPDMPASNSRAAKRARLKASRNKTVGSISHPNGPCGNIGCKRCSYTAAAADRRIRGPLLAAIAKAKRD